MKNERGLSMTEMENREFSTVDPHCHSKYSGEPSEWFLRKLECPESFTEPLQVYETAKMRGMQFVTITDHNVIGGCLEIAHLPNAFVSCEVASYFPDNMCKIDILTLDITEEQYGECMKLRQNVYDLVRYLNDESIFHILAHPLYVMNRGLDLDHVEKCLLLFKNMEILNGTRTKVQNLTIQRVLENLTRETIERLANKHDLEPVGSEPWKKNLTGGSDDHGGLLIGTVSTAVPRVESFAEFVESVRAGNSRPLGTIGTSHSLAHTIYRVAYSYIVNVLKAYHPSKGDMINYVVMKLLFDDESCKPTVMDVVLQKIKKLLGMGYPDTSPYQILTMIKVEAKNLVKIKPAHKRLLLEPLPKDKDEYNRAVFEFMSDLANILFTRLTEELFKAFDEASVGKIVELIAAFGTAHFLLLPYYVAYGTTNRSNKLIEQVNNAYVPPDQQVRNKKKVAMFTDTYDEINGVAIIVKQMVEQAEKSGKDLFLIKAGPEESYRDGNVVHFHSLADVSAPDYPEIKIRFPNLLDILDFCEREELTSIHSATPGTMGLIALLVSRILNLPFIGTYHTEVTEYARYLTGSESMTKMFSKLVRWYYDFMEVVFAPSESARFNLVDHGINPDIVHFIPWGVDTELFSTDRRDMDIWKKYGNSDSLKILYTGRISKEKDLDVLADAFIELSKERDDLQLFLAGDGPYKEKIQKKLADYPAVFLGYLEHDELSTYYASADMFVFPSTTDTFGNVVIEAQACGLPVIVSDKGGPKENVRHGINGLVTPAKDVKALKDAIVLLADDEGLRKRMAVSGRASVDGKSSYDAFQKYWKLHR